MRRANAALVALLGALAAVGGLLVLAPVASGAPASTAANAVANTVAAKAPCHKDRKRGEVARRCTTTATPTKTTTATPTKTTTPAPTKTTTTAPTGTGDRYLWPVGGVALQPHTAGTIRYTCGGGEYGDRIDSWELFSGQNLASVTVARESDTAVLVSYDNQTGEVQHFTLFLNCQDTSGL
jgi:hypothetical protein